MNKQNLTIAKLEHLESLLWEHFCDVISKADGGEQMALIVTEQDLLYSKFLKAKDYSDEEIEKILKFVNYSGV